MARAKLIAVIVLCGITCILSLYAREEANADKGKGEADVQPKQIPSQVVIGPMEVRDAKFTQCLKSLSEKAKMPVCIEDVSLEKETKLGSMKVDLSVAAGTVFSKALDDLESKYPVFTWTVDDNNVINIAATGRPEGDANPLNKKMNFFNFEGNLPDAVRSLFKVSEDILLSMNMDGHAEKRQVKISFATEMTVREILNAITVDTGLEWHVQVSKELSLLKITDENDVDVVEPTKTRSVQFYFQGGDFSNLVTNASHTEEEGK
jgi:hypothetical protein